ncbi:TetR/AcrR family transcriptional regulator [Pseudoduganella sp. RAF53_2]|uniref:TetR/AcrR family transcriptional regulator n=1 Tax=unclassified Pseudoduganella TaxID=2637179 RepID=UPI003F9E0C41
MSTRAYESPARQAAAEEKRARVVAAATVLLRDRDNNRVVSLEAVAKAAGVTRLTVYNQFGSRSGLLEAVLDQVAREAGMERVAEAMCHQDPNASLELLIDLVCRAWGHDDSMRSLHAAAEMDQELAAAIGKRTERRRGALNVLVKRISAGRWSDEHQLDMVDMLYAATSFPVFESLRQRGRSVEEVAKLFKHACAGIIRSS